MLKSLSALVVVLLVTGCGRNGGPNASNDFDCAVTAASYLDAAKSSGAPAEQQHALYVLNQWYAARWSDQNPGESSKAASAGAPLVEAISRDPQKYGEVLKTCGDRANEDPRFAKFADLMK